MMIDSNRILFLLVFLICSLSSVAQEFIPQSPLELKLLSHQSTEDVELKSKVEIGFVVPADLQQKMNNFFNGRAVHRSQKINPFLDWELLIEATFTHEETGEKIMRHGFYYRKMQRDEANDYWRDVHDDFTLRVRFLPERTGKWDCQIKLLEFGKTTHTAIPMTFKVKESERPGYVGLNKNKRYFERDGKIVVPAGINNPSPMILNNMLYNWNNDARLRMATWKEFNNSIERYALQGGKFFRFFLTPSCSDIEFEEMGNYYERQNFAWEIDNMLEICEREDVLINFNMLIHTPIMKMADYYQFRWDYTSNWHDPKAWPHRDQNPVYAYSAYLNSNTPSDMFLNKETIEYLKQRTRYIIARWGYSTAINCFEILSEPWHMNEDGFRHITPYDSIGSLGDSSRKAAHIYHREMANYIKNDLNHQSHLLGAVGKIPRGGNHEFFPHPNKNQFAYKDSSWFEENIDFISISYYSSNPSKLIISKRGRDNNSCESNENSMFCAIQNLTDKYDKPVIFGEADHGDATHYCSELEGHQIDIMRFNLSGAAGHYVWRAFVYPHPEEDAIMDERISWPGLIVAQDVFNGAVFTQTLDDFGLQGREKTSLRGTKTDLKEHQYILSRGAETGLGYIYNRTYNIHTAPINKDNIENTSCYIEDQELNQAIKIEWRPKKMKVEGLKRRGEYSIKFYSYKTGEFISAVTTKANIFGKLSLEHPTLGDNRFNNPLIWYVIEKK